jgi:hypothetical protein
MSIDQKAQTSASFDGYLPVIELFRGKTRQTVVHYVAVNVHHKPFRQADIVDQTKITQESFRKHREMLEELGVITCVTDESENIPHYQPGDTDVIRVLRTWGLKTPLTLFETTGSQALVEFFLTSADSETSYSISQIGREGGPGYDAVSGNISRLVNSRLVTEEAGSRGTEYRLNPESDTYRFILELNNTVHATRKR